MSADCAVCKAEDIGRQELSYAEVKAIASGNSAVLTLAEADAERQRLAILRKNHRDEQSLTRRNLRDLPEEIARRQGRLEPLTADLATIGSNDGIPSQETVAHRMNQMSERVEKSCHTELGTYRGLECGLIVHPSGGTEVDLDGATRCRQQVVRDKPGPRAVLNALERLADGSEGEIRHLKAEIALKEGQLRDYEGRIGREFEPERYAEQLADLREELKLGLSEKAPEGGTPTAELAEQIKTLRASVTVEAAPERTGTRKAARAERPVTARIRERLVEQPAAKADPQVEEVKPEPVQAPEPVAKIIPLPVAKPIKEKLEGGNPGTPPDGTSGGVIPAIYLERGHSRRVARRRSNDGAQLLLF